MGPEKGTVLGWALDGSGSGWKLGWVAGLSKIEANQASQRNWSLGFAQLGNGYLDQVGPWVFYHIQVKVISGFQEMESIM